MSRTVILVAAMLRILAVRDHAPLWAAAPQIERDAVSVDVDSSSDESVDSQTGKEGPSVPRASDKSGASQESKSKASASGDDDDHSADKAKSHVGKADSRDDRQETRKEQGESRSAKPDAQARKPAIYRVETKDLEIDVESEGVFIAGDAEELALRPELWTTFKVVEAVSHGARVRRGEVLVKFDERDIQRAIADKSLDLRLGEVALMKAEEDFPRLEEAVELALTEAQRDYDNVVQEYSRFKQTMRALSEKYSAYNLKSSEQMLDNASEELEQLQKMYEADELTEETEEIVLRRQQFEVEVAKFHLEYSKVNHDYTISVSIPRRAAELQTAVEKAKLNLERAKTAKSLGLTEKRYELEARRERRARSVEDHAKLIADRALMILRAPADGVAYYGRSVNGRWGEVASYETKLVPFGTVSPNSVLMTVIGERPKRLQFSIGEKEITGLKVDQSATITPTSDSEIELTGRVESVDAFPRAGNQFNVQIALHEPELPEWLKPGMTGKSSITTYAASNVVVIPDSLVQTDEGDPKSKYVMVRVPGQDRPVRRDIELGKKKGKDVEVRSGVEAGDMIIKGAKDDADRDGAISADDS